MKKVILVLSVVLCGAISFGFNYTKEQQNNAVFEIVPENPGKPLTLEYSSMYTGAIVEGYDGENVLVELYRGNGRSRMNNPPVQYTERDDRIVLSHGLNTTKNLQFKIKVPKNTTLFLDGSLASHFEVSNLEGNVTISTFDGDIVVNQVVGDLDAKTFKGDIMVTNLTGSPLLNTNEGDVELAFSELPESYPNIIICNYGEISLYLDKDAKVSFRFKMVFNFEKIKTDFRLQALNPKNFPMGVEDGDNFYRAINGGGIPIYIRQFNGSLRIKDSATRK